MIATLPCKVRVIAILDDALLQRAARSTNGARRQPTPLVMICYQGCLAIMSRGRSMFGSHAGLE